MFEQMVGVFLGEGGVGSDIAVDGQPDEPAVMQDVDNLLRQLTLAAHRKENLDERRPQISANRRWRAQCRRRSD